MEENNGLERILDCNEAGKTYHIRFARLCDTKTELLMDLNELIVGWGGQVPLELIEEFNSQIAAFNVHLDEFKECLQLIGENHVKACDIYLEEVKQRDDLIEKYAEHAEVSIELVKRMEREISRLEALLPAS